MSFVTSEKMLLDAQKGGYAVGAFNVENMEMVMAVIAAAEELRAPLMMQTTPSTIKYAGLDMYLANVKAAAEKASVPCVCTWTTATALIWPCGRCAQAIPPS